MAATFFSSQTDVNTSKPSRDAAETNLNFPICGLRSSWQLIAGWDSFTSSLDPEQKTVTSSAYKRHFRGIPNHILFILESKFILSHRPFIAIMKREGEISQAPQRIESIKGSRNSNYCFGVSNERKTTLLTNNDPLKPISKEKVDETRSGNDVSMNGSTSSVIGGGGAGGVEVARTNSRDGKVATVAKPGGYRAVGKGEGVDPNGKVLEDDGSIESNKKSNMSSVYVSEEIKELS
ncbi:unnamed protein product [Lepeophtheirus salmonis]|uniref:(salmon louse) hypothetical protein n=1 Tax=Lepeophtheirus salmonis TaxID=72036 RepID=A0A7R8HAZ8_LEPSM|nr:unnamed protein product [Lepeophtheirus salmonis]CAF2978539.1 unnamed protein product [Lepeophtheirus salmonis]